MGNEPANGRIEAIDLAIGAVEVLYDGCGDVPLRHPNDIAFDVHGGFWFTDRGKVQGRNLDRGAVYQAFPDGSEIREAIYPLPTPNGIGPDLRTAWIIASGNGRLIEMHWHEPGPRLNWQQPRQGSA